MEPRRNNPDVLCVGTAAYDLIFSVDAEPGADDKIDASGLIRCGGGPAANAAVTISRLGHSVAFAGYLGHDPFGDENMRELTEAGVDTSLVARGSPSTPLSSVWVKPDGSRSLVNYRDDRGHLPLASIDLAQVRPKAVLFDGHEPVISTSLAIDARRLGIPIILDAGSVRQSTVELAGRCDHLVCASKFALGYIGAESEQAALAQLARLAPAVVITLGDRGLIWRRGQEQGRQPAFAVDAVDTTGAGDIFHGAYVVALLENMAWAETLRFASAAAALCCTEIGARLGVPIRSQVDRFLDSDPPLRER